MQMDATSGQGCIVQIQRLRSSGDLPLPSYASDGAAGVDLRACLEEDLVVEPGGTILVPTGFAIAIPDGFEAQIRPRSGLALNHSISLPNAPGTIDCDYRGEVQIILVNHGSEPFTIKHGMRIAQMVFAPVIRVDLEETVQLPVTRRGAGGFGSTGR